MSVCILIDYVFDQFSLKVLGGYHYRANSCLQWQLEAFASNVIVAVLLSMIIWVS
ncbi:hypothetical protein BDV25DRAFT_160545 [Aspergillus avenaceus]|uniref:Uncharacterized protein n=1 Tax=Aspergillus avenaceus TaxID=36643 RepID=A0A5N6TM59_ASPAV|nr:hypothetical protein BDV25DRAFT_160545 [Aspergillus avenaceus]